MDLSCRACLARETTVFFENAAVPVHSNLLFDSAEDALDQRQGRIVLSYCGLCGFIQNSAFDAALVGYEGGYEDAQTHSPRFRSFADALVEHLVDAYDLQNRRILEIGCGQGDFLRRLCEAGENEGLGFDPVYTGPSEVPLARGRMSIRPEAYGREHVGLPFDFAFLRHTLEHIPDVAAFVSLMGRNFPKGTPLYVEVPDSGRILEQTAYWDVYYEHSSYFTEASLCSLLVRQGFRVQRSSLGYGDQYLMVEAISGAGSEGGALQAEAAEERDLLVTRAQAFSHHMTDLLEDWRQRLEGWQASGSSVVLWGAGSKSVGFLSAIAGTEKARLDSIRAIVDVNPAKQGSFQAGIGHEIVSPDDLAALKPDVVVIMNAIYREEIGRQLHDLGLDPLTVAL